MAGALLEKSGAVGALHVPQKSEWGTSCAPKIKSAPQSAPGFNGGKPLFPSLMGHWGTFSKEFFKTSKKGKYMGILYIYKKTRQKVPQCPVCRGAVA